MINQNKNLENYSKDIVSNKCSLFKKLIEIEDDNHDHSKRAGSENGRKAREVISNEIKSSNILSNIINIKEENFEFDSVEPIQSITKIIYNHNQVLSDVHLYDNTGYRDGLSGEELCIPPKKLFYVKKRLNIFQRKKARNKIVVFDLAKIAPHRTEQVHSALKAGAEGVILVAPGDMIRTGVGYPYADFEETSFPDISNFKHSKIPVIGIIQNQWEEIQKHKNKEIKIEFAFKQETLNGANLIIDIMNNQYESEEGNIIVVGAHYDTWLTGAQDNCVSVQTLFTVLEELFKDKINPPKHAIRAIFWDAEELGMLGSLYHISKPANQKFVNRYKFYLNFEMCIPTSLKRFNNFLLYNSIGPEPLPPYGRFNFDIYNLIARIMGSKGFPSDVDILLKKKISSATTACLNDHYHTISDDGHNIHWELYADIVHWLTNYIKKIDATI